MHGRYKLRVYRQGSGQERISVERLRVFNADESLPMAEAVVKALYGSQCSAIRLLENGGGKAMTFSGAGQRSYHPASKYMEALHSHRNRAG